MADAGGIVAALRDMASVKSLSDDEMNDLIKDGILAGLARIHGPNVEAEISIDDGSGSIDIIVLKRVVDEVEDASTEVNIEKARWDDPTFELGDVMEIPVEFDQFGRNAVMATKQRIVQRIREGERERIRDEYADRVGELLSGEVQQIERGKMVIMLNRSRDADVIIPWREQNPRERFRQGDPIRAVLKKVDETPKGPRLILSRGDPLFVAALFNLEVPEIYQGIVEIQEIAREVGGRTKIAVSSSDESIDPVGACVGMKGSRVQAVVSELGGERIDIVPWHPDPEIFARRALAPARVSKVLCDRETQVITAIVDEDQLSLAIGRNGQNVRLASQLIGWQIDLYGSREWLERGAGDVLFDAPPDDTYEMADFPLEELDIDKAVLASLKGAGYSSFLDIIDLEEADFKAVSGIDEEGAQRLLKLIDELTIVETPVAAETGSAETESTTADTESAEEPTADAVAEPIEGGRNRRPFDGGRVAASGRPAALAHLGLARRAGALEIGVAAARQAVRDGRARLVVVAGDGAEGQRMKVLAIAQAREVPVCIVATSDELGAATGLGSVTAVAVTDAGLALAARAAMEEGQ